MALETYNDLIENIASHLDRDSDQVLMDQIPTFIRLAEGLHRTEVRIREMLVRSQVFVDNRYMALPSGFLEMKILRLLTNPKPVSLNYMNLDLLTTHSVNEGTYRPSNYTVHEEIEFDTFPDQTYTAEMIYYAAVTPLSENVNTNAVYATYPALYLYGALVHTAPFLLHDERIPVWQGFYANIRDLANAAARKSATAGPMVSRVRPGLP